MIDIHSVASLAAVYACGVVIPGPNFVAVTHEAVSASLARALAMVGGIVAVNIFWATSAIFGVGAVLAVFPWIAIGVKLAGALYLTWFGLRLMLSPTKALPPSKASDKVGNAARAFRRGVAVNIVNPKSIAFYAAIFSTAAPKDVSVATFAAMLGCVSVIASLWYGAVALFFSRPAVARWFERSATVFNRACGSVLVGLGVKHTLSVDS